MRYLITICTTFACVLAPIQAVSQPTAQPPMNQFNQAFYTCASGGAFIMSYESDTPTTAKMTTSNDNRQYALKRTASGKGVAFAAGRVKFWTDGKAVAVEGTKTQFQNCKMKPT